MDAQVASELLRHTRHGNVHRTLTQSNVLPAEDVHGTSNAGTRSPWFAESVFRYGIPRMRGAQNPITLTISDSGLRVECHILDFSTPIRRRRTDPR
jgi:hypothetical protein